ncbi:hypothetical protein Nit79A3_0248 [Nitrosomonas sp. Is79A3]|uniref:hypothetical protein n=1 Tax=Nitrosomonas sp. (strain Is79A3) TaxID=261292 RepID=UPI000215D181
MMNNLTTAKNDLVNLQQKDDAFSTKLVSAEREQISQRQELDGATANRDAIEKRHIMDQASEAEVTAAQKLCDTLEAKLATTNRRVELINAARNELAPKIAAAAGNLRIARRDYCVEISNESLQKIRENKQFRDLLLASMAAFAANGQYHHTFSVHRFVEQNLTQILPGISEDEVRIATEKFTKESDLEV